MGNSGLRWLRWEPHIHAPGTVLNDQLKGTDTRTEYLARIEAAKRQVIMVTHNANLVINTDADQIIVAAAGTHSPGELPPITYRSGGLEDADMRKHVCDILEGGEAAFKERAGACVYGLTDKPLVIRLWFQRQGTCRAQY